MFHIGYTRVKVNNTMNSFTVPPQHLSDLTSSEKIKQFDKPVKLLQYGCVLATTCKFCMVLLTRSLPIVVICGVKLHRKASWTNPFTLDYKGNWLKQNYKLTSYCYKSVSPLYFIQVLSSEGGSTPSMFFPICFHNKATDKLAAWAILKYITHNKLVQVFMWNYTNYMPQHAF